MIEIMTVIDKKKAEKFVKTLKKYLVSDIEISIIEKSPKQYTVYTTKKNCESQLISALACIIAVTQIQLSGLDLI